MQSVDNPERVGMDLDNAFISGASNAAEAMR